MISWGPKGTLRIQYPIFTHRPAMLMSGKKKKNLAGATIFHVNDVACRNWYVIELVCVVTHVKMTLF
jgi:hypothetical protein